MKATGRVLGLGAISAGQWQAHDFLTLFRLACCKSWELCHWFFLKFEGLGDCSQSIMCARVLCFDVEYQVQLMPEALLQHAALARAMNVF